MNDSNDTISVLLSCILLLITITISSPTARIKLKCQRNFFLSKVLYNETVSLKKCIKIERELRYE